MTESISEQLLRILTLETVDANLFRGTHEGIVGMRLFGGQVLAQALAAANNTVEPERLCHSLHGYFLRPGSPDVPVIYRVERIRDGRSFTTRRIVALQYGEAIFSMDASFQVPETGLSHQIDMVEVPGPELLEDDVILARRAGVSNDWSKRERPFEIRSVAQLSNAAENRTENPVWIRFKSAVANEQRLHQQLLAYASDMGLVSTSFLPHQETHDRSGIQTASLDHALWFHHPINITEWLVYMKESTSTASARGFNRGAFYTADGKLVASAMQEGLIRLKRGA